MDSADTAGGQDTARPSLSTREAAQRAGVNERTVRRAIADGRLGDVQDHIVFTYDDVRCAQNVPPLVPPPNRIVSIREAQYKLARYYDGDGIEPDQWEMYGLETDPLERVNLTFPGFTLTTDQSTVHERLTAKLREVEATRLQPLPGKSGMSAGSWRL